MKIDVEILEVEEQIYLGEKPRLKKDHEREIRRITIARKRVVTRRNLPMYTRMKYTPYHDCIIPSIMYGCHTSKLTKSTEIQKK